MRLITFIIFLNLFIAPRLLQAQNVKVVNDFRSRASFKIDKEVFNKLKLYGEIELGMEQNSSKLGKLLAETGITYSPLKFLDFETHYRLTKNRRNYTDRYKYTHQFALSAEAKQKIDRARLYYRIQYQNIDDDATTYTSFAEHRNIYKNRLKVKYNIRKSKFTPFASTEIYIIPGTKNIEATKLKSMIGMEYNLPKKNEIKIYYRNDRELTNYLPYTYHTLGFSYLIKL